MKQDVEIGAFLAVCVAPTIAISASYRLRRFFTIDTCYTKSQFPMMLMIVYSININDNVLPLLQALVPIENEEQQTQFLTFLTTHFAIMSKEDYVFISNRDKGIVVAISS